MIKKWNKWPKWNRWPVNKESKEWELNNIVQNLKIINSDSCRAEDMTIALTILNLPRDTQKQALEMIYILVPHCAYATILPFDKKLTQEDKKRKQYRSITNW